MTIHYGNAHSDFSSAQHAHTGAAGDGAVPFYVRKSATETVNNSAVLQNDDHLLKAIGANESWVFDFELQVTAAGSTGGFRIAITVPSGSMFLQAIGGGDSALIKGTSIVSGTAITLGNGSGLAMTLIKARALVRNGATPGNVQLQWAQSGAVASDLTLGVESFMTGFRVA